MVMRGEKSAQPLGMRIIDANFGLIGVVSEIGF
jgi:rRNA processing protein Gar1